MDIKYNAVVFDQFPPTSCATAGIAPLTDHEIDFYHDNKFGRYEITKKHSEELERKLKLLPINIQVHQYLASWDLASEHLDENRMGPQWDYRREFERILFISVLKIIPTNALDSNVEVASVIKRWFNLDSQDFTTLETWGQIQARIRDVDISKTDVHVEKNELKACLHFIHFTDPESHSGLMKFKIKKQDRVPLIYEAKARLQILQGLIEPSLAFSYLPNGKASFAFDKNWTDGRKRRAKMIIQFIAGLLALLTFILSNKDYHAESLRIGYVLLGFSAISLIFDYYFDAYCENMCHPQLKWKIAVIFGYLPGVERIPAEFFVNPVHEKIKIARETFLRLRAAFFDCCLSDES